MAVTITFNAIRLGGSGLANLTTGGSGLGFYGSGGFGTSVPVGSYQGSTYVCNAGGSAGSQSGYQANNVAYTNANSGTVTGANYDLNAIPNKNATLNISLLSSAGPVNVRNVQLYIYDNNLVSNAPSGVTTQVAELCNPTGILLNTNQVGSGTQAWWQAAANASYQLANNPGSGGSGMIGQSNSSPTSNGGTATGTSTQHDWYLALSASPTQIGSKSAYGIYVSLEYL